MSPSSIRWPCRIGSGFAMAELRYASGLFNLMRNLGGAIGIAVVNTWLGDNTRLHVARLGRGWARPAALRPTSWPFSPGGSARSRPIRPMPP
jgi:hypothetical protein